MRPAGTGRSHPEKAGGRRAFTVRPAVAKDVAAIAQIGCDSFSGLRPIEAADRWVQSCSRAAPRAGYWVAETDEGIVGYILWIEKGGFRKDAVYELEQIAVRADARRKGIGRRLILESLSDLQRSLEARSSRLKLIEVTTGSEQGALDFYREAIGTEVVGRIPDFFRGDEYILIARGPFPSAK